MWHGERWRETKQAPTIRPMLLLKVGRRREEKWKINVNEEEDELQDICMFCNNKLWRHFFGQHQFGHSGTT
jgi:hypothetical protein